MLSLTQAAALTEAVLEYLSIANQPATIQVVIPAVFEHVLSRAPKPQETRACEKMLSKHATVSNTVLPTAAIQSLIHVLMNHNDFVTIR